MQAAVAAAGPGDTVLIPAGTATWNTCLSITKGIILRGAGADQTTIIGNITDSTGGIIKYAPACPALDEPFRITGFTLDGNFTCNVIFIENNTGTKISKIRIDRNTIMNAGEHNAGRCIGISGTAYGVIDNNTFSGAGKMIDVYGPGQIAWNNFTFDYGTPDNICKYPPAEPEALRLLAPQRG